MQAQITIGGDVYGGGNAGDTNGNTNVTIYAGDLHNVYGGARQADVTGSTFVHIDGEHASSYIVIDKAYGGNDIAGTIGSNPASKVLPSELTRTTENGIDNTWDAYVRISTKLNDSGEEATNAKKVYIGQLFGGGNGDYDYTSNDSPYNGMTRPEIGKTYLELLGGSIVYAYGGGNNATVTNRTVIALDNPSKVVCSIRDANNPNADNTGEVLNNARFEDRMGINTSFSYPSSDEYQIGRFFGGNNKADMAIRPTWNLQKGRIRNLYSGGNQGRMTYYDPATGYGGIFLTITSDGMVVDNVYGGCRMSDVCPGGDSENPQDVEEEITNGLVLPGGYSARVTISGGNINNVYGGNDISGTVYGGCAVGIHSSIKGDVYGGGNGSYAYTDNPALEDVPRWRDFYYNPDVVLAAAGVTGVSDDLKSVTALNMVRPNAEKVTVRLISDHPDPTKNDYKPTIIGGAVYCGGNSATLRSSNGTPTSQLKIGSCVYADKVFLGSNGANMVSSEMFTNMAGSVKVGVDDYGFSQIDLTQQNQMNEYMKGCEMDVRPEVVFDQPYDGVEGHEGYRDYSTYIGSFFWR